MPDPASISLLLDELRAVLSAAEEHPPAAHVTVERHDAVVVAKRTWRPADAGTAEGGHGGAPPRWSSTGARRSLSTSITLRSCAVARREQQHPASGTSIRNVDRRGSFVEASSAMIRPANARSLRLVTPV